MVAREGWRILIPPRPTPPSKAQALVRMIEIYLRKILRWTLKLYFDWDVTENIEMYLMNLLERLQHVWTWKAAPGSTFQFSSPAPPSQPRLRKPVPSNYKLVNCETFDDNHHHNDQIMIMVMITATSLSSAVSLSTWSVSKSTRATSAGSPRSNRIWPWWLVVVRSSITIRITYQHNGLVFNGGNVSTSDLHLGKVTMIKTWLWLWWWWWWWWWRSWWWLSWWLNADDDDVFVTFVPFIFKAWHSFAW